MTMPTVYRTAATRARLSRSHAWRFSNADVPAVSFTLVQARRVLPPRFAGGARHALGVAPCSSRMSARADVSRGLSGSGAV